MARQKHWVFESEAPLEEFGKRLKMVLRGRGHGIDDARVFDFAAEVEGAKAFVALAYHHRGIEVTVKVKAGLFSDEDPAFREVFEAVRRTQVELAGLLSDGDQQGDDADQRPAQAGSGDVAGAQAHQDERHGEQDEDRGQPR